MNLILLGAPGAGKGTQAEFICEKLSIPTISTGNIIRDSIKNKTDLGVKAKSFIDSGNLVPDDIVIDIIKERLSHSDCDSGFILDGFPRTVPQAEALDSMGINIDRVIDIEVEDDKIIQRLSGRRVCEDCGCSYHVFYKPTKIDGVCDSCSGKTIQRKDDHIDIVRKRLDVYYEQTEPLKEYYNSKGKLYIVKGQEKIEDTTKLTLKALEA